MTRRLVSVMDPKPKVPVFLFDIDGTCADHSARLPYIDRALPPEQRDWARFHEECHLDPPIRAVCQLARALHYGHIPLIFATGRMEHQREKTAGWLSENIATGWSGYMCPYQGFDYNEHAWDAQWQPKGGFPWLLMRAEGDFREDTIIKGEMLDRIQIYLKARMPDYEVVMAFEDRPRICDLWRARGLTVAKIGAWTEDKQAPASEAFAKIAEVIAEQIGTDDEQLGLEKA